jgi:hypothetical protein
MPMSRMMVHNEVRFGPPFKTYAFVDTRWSPHTLDAGPALKGYMAGERSAFTRSLAMEMMN